MSACSSRSFPCCRGICGWPRGHIFRRTPRRWRWARWNLSAGCAALRACTLAPVWKLCIASFLLSFGGLSILAQSRAAAADAGLEGRQLPGCKMLQGAIAAALTLLLAPLAQAGRWCAPTLGASTMTETAGPVMLLLSSVLLLYFRKKYHSILREGRV